MNLRKLYIQSLIYPAIIVVAVSIVYSVLIAMLSEQPEGEHIYSWYEQVIINTVAAIIFSGLISVLSLTIFLNKNTGFSSNKYRLVLSWFLLPYGFILLVIGKAITELLTLNSYWEITHALLASTPFIIGLQRGFSKFSSALPNKVS